MLSSVSNTVVCFIVCHGGPADHCAMYAQTLKEEGYDVQIHATEIALKKFEDLSIKVKSSFNLDDLAPGQDDLLAGNIAKACSAASVVITDIGHVFAVKMQQALVDHAHKAKRYCYYDNPESYVPGGYSSTAAEVIKIAEGVLFANKHLAKAKIYSTPEVEISFADKKRFGIGYYPLNRAEEIAEKRKSDRDIIRSKFLMDNGFNESQQKILVYFGGNNAEYFNDAFPAFLSYLKKTAKKIDLKNTIIVLQQHPSAKRNNLDGQQVDLWINKNDGEIGMPKVILSTFSSDHAQILADAALYYQTSMGPQFVLAGIPTIQIGHATYDDVLIRNGLAPSVTNEEEFVKVIEKLANWEKMPKKDLLKGLGIKEDWRNRLKNIVEKEI